MLTSADSHRNNASTLVKRAIEELDEILLKQCDGHDDFKTQFLRELDDCRAQLVTIYRTIGVSKG